MRAPPSARSIGSHKIVAHVMFLYEFTLGIPNATSLRSLGEIRGLLTFIGNPEN
jgi:hypothetical protein